MGSRVNQARLPIYWEPKRFGKVQLKAKKEGP